MSAKVVDLHGFELKRPLAVEMLEEVAFVGLVPTEFPGRNRAEVQAVDVGGVHDQDAANSSDARNGNSLFIPENGIIEPHVPR